MNHLTDGMMTTKFMRHLFLFMVLIAGIAASAQNTMLKAKFEAEQFCLGEATKFSDISEFQGSKVVSKTWDFGDGYQSDKGQEVLHKYGKAGEYTVVLTIKNELGQRAKMRRKIVITAKPEKPSITEYLAVCEGEKTMLTANSNSDEVYWSTSLSSDDNFHKGAYFSVEHLEPGKHDIFVSAGKECASEAAKVRVVVMNNKSTSRVINNVCVNQTEMKLSSNQSVDGVWSGNAISNVKEGIFSPHEAGIGEHLLHFKSNAKCNNDEFVKIKVISAPNADFKLKQNGSTVRFENNSSDYSSLNWSFGDGRTSEKANPVHVYKNKGNYNATLTVTDKLGCKAEKFASIKVNQSRALSSQLLNSELKIYPIPSNGQVNIDFREFPVEAVEIKVFDIVGNEVFAQNFISDDKRRKSFDLGHLHRGTYFVNISTGSAVTSRRISLKKE